jgi:hypothetical protein
MSTIMTVVGASWNVAQACAQVACLQVVLYINELVTLFHLGKQRYHLTRYLADHYPRPSPVVTKLIVESSFGRIKYSY